MVKKFLLLISLCLFASCLEAMEAPKSASSEQVQAKCANCGKIAKQQLCGKCKQVSYCSRECQVADWKKGHKSACKPVEQAKSIVLGDVEQVAQRVQKVRLQYEPGFVLGNYLTDAIIKNTVPQLLTANFFKKFKNILLEKGGAAGMQVLEARKNSMLFMLDECRGVSCPFRRIEYPTIRESAEVASCEYIKVHFSNDTKFSFTSFGCDKLFSELYILTKLAYALKKEKVKNHFYVNLIEQMYENVLAFYALPQSQWWLSTPEATNVTHAELESQKGDLQVVYHILLCQFLQWVKMLERDANCTIEVRLYVNLNDYMRECQVNQDLKCHIFNANDMSQARMQLNIPNILATSIHRSIYDCVRNNGVACFSVSQGTMKLTPTTGFKEVGCGIEELMLGIDTTKTPRVVKQHRFTRIEDGKIISQDTSENYVLPIKRDYSEYSFMSLALPNSLASLGL